MGLAILLDRFCVLCRIEIIFYVGLKWFFTKTLNKISSSDQLSFWNFDMGAKSICALLVYVQPLLYQVRLLGNIICRKYLQVIVGVEWGFTVNVLILETKFFVRPYRKFLVFLYNIIYKLTKIKKSLIPCINDTCYHINATVNHHMHNQNLKTFN